MSRSAAVLIPAAALVFLSGCLAHDRPAPTLTGEPSIERGLDRLAALPASAPLVRFLYEHPVTFQYSRVHGTCCIYSLKAGVIYLPRELKGQDKLLAATLARAAYVYRLGILSGLDEAISEEEETAALFQARIGLALGLTEKDFGANKAAKSIESELCAYLMEGAKAAMLSARAAALSARPECRRPLDTLQVRREWIGDIRSVVDDESSFFQLMKDRDLAKVRKGSMTMSEAMRNDADVRALPTYELYRRQREIYETQTEVLSRIEKLYRAAMKEDENWREANRTALEAAQAEFSACSVAARPDGPAPRR